MESEHMDQFEQELKQALELRPAPPNLKRKVMERRSRNQLQRRRNSSLLWMRIAAGVVLAALLGGAANWEVRRTEDQRRGEEARRQVMLALRITGHALNQMNAQFAAHDRSSGD